MTISLAPGRAPNLPVTATTTPPPSIGNEMRNNAKLSTQTVFHVKGWRRVIGRDERVETRITAPSKDYARYIAHQRGIRVAECEVMKR